MFEDLKAKVQLTCMPVQSACICPEIVHVEVNIHQKCSHQQDQHNTERFADLM